MSAETRKYVRKIEEVQAVRADIDNLDELREIAPEIRRHNRYSVFYDIADMPEVLWSGDWLVKHEDGSLEIISDRNFKNYYERK